MERRVTGGGAILGRLGIDTTWHKVHEVPRIGGLPVPPHGMLRLIGPKGHTVVLIISGDPDRSGSVGGWAQSTRVLAEDADYWVGRPKATATWPCLLHVDGLPGDRSIEDRLDEVYWLGQSHDGEEPPVIRLSGDVPARDRRLEWKLDDVALGARRYLGNDARTLRSIAVTLSMSSRRLVADVDRVALRPTRDKQGQRRQRQPVRTRQGDTLRSIAVRELGSSADWVKLRQWNPKLKKIDPDDPLRRGTKVALKG
jgi:hypothetical protein